MFSGLLAFWGLLLAYLLGPLAVFFFLNRLFGDERSSSASVLAACFGLGPLLFSWGLLALMAAMPGKPYSFHLWTLSGLTLLFLAASERRGFDCMREFGHGAVRLLTSSRDAFWNWKENWLTLPLFALAAALFALGWCLCAMLPPSSPDFLASLAMAREGFATARLSGDLSANGGLLLWSFIVQDSAAEAGIAKFAAPAFALAIAALVAALPFKNVFNRAVAMALTMLALFPAICLASPLLAQIYALLLLLRFLVAFALDRSRFNAAVCVLAFGSALAFSPSEPCEDALHLPLVLGLSAFMALLGILLGGWKRKIVMTAIVAALCLPAFDFAQRKAAEFPLAWSLPALPELPIAVNSSNGRFAIFSHIVAEIPEGGAILTPYPSDVAYYAPGRKTLPLDFGKNGQALLERQLPFYVCLPPERGNALERLFLAKAKPFLDTRKAEQLFEANGWRLLRLSE